MSKPGRLDVDTCPGAAWLLQARKSSDGGRDPGLLDLGSPSP